MQRSRLFCPVVFLVASGLYAHWPGNSLPDGTVADRIVVEKSKRRLTLFRGEKALKRYAVALGRDPVGRKEREGDQRTPEGTYRIWGRNTRSKFHLSLRISYPDADDRHRAEKGGFAPGGDIMIHGIRNGSGWLGRFHRVRDWTAGCVAVTNREIEEIWRVVPDGTRIEIRP